MQPSHLPDGAAIRYAWNIASYNRAEAEAIANLARRLRALGWGIDLALGHGEIREMMPATPHDGYTRWLPQTSGTAGVALPVARRDTLAGLDADHQAAQQRIQGTTQTLTGRSAPFDRIAYRDEHDLPPRPMRAFRLINPDGSSSAFWPTQARDLAAMFRHQAHEAAKRAEWSPAIVRGYVCGHGENGGPPPANRLSYLPMPSIGHRHTDGLIRRVALVETPGGDGLRLHELADRLIGQHLVRERDGKSVAVLVQPEASDGVTPQYRGDVDSGKPKPAAVWASATPVVLPGFNGRGRTNQDRQRVLPSQPGSELTGQPRKAHRLVLRMLKDAGIPVGLVSEVWLQKLPLWPSLPHAAKSDRPAYLQHRPPFHVRLRFRQPVHGPITLGAGRFVGLGTFVAVRRQGHTQQRQSDRE